MDLCNCKTNCIGIVNTAEYESCTVYDFIIG